MATEAADRREQQRRQNAQIGVGTSLVPTAEIHTLDEMLARFVLITDGSLVAPLDRPREAVSLADFRNAAAGSKVWAENKAVPAVKAWLEHPNRLQASTLTFRAGAARMTPAPECGRMALNIWSPFERAQAPDDWKAWAQPFVEHIQWLWGSDAEPFLDWLAHIEQRPGVLPHFGWVHMSRTHGTGRNWLSSVLARLWRGHVAASLDLMAVLEPDEIKKSSTDSIELVDHYRVDDTALNISQELLECGAIKAAA